MPNEKLLVDKGRVKILKEQIDCDKSSKDEFIRGLGEGMRIALEFLTEEMKS
jgi:hypothetical protein